MAVALLLGSGVLVGVQTPARAHDHEPPKAPFLYKGQRELQRGNWLASCWVYPPNSEGIYTTLCTDYAIDFPAADRVGAGSELHIRVLKIQRPENFVVVAYKKVNEEEVPIGSGRQLRTSLQRIVQDGQTVGWDVIFRANRPDRRYYLEAGGEWKDEHAEGVSQDAVWTFHVKTGS
jgi:hypothetical protein